MSITAQEAFNRRKGACPLYLDELLIGTKRTKTRRKNGICK